MGSIKVCAAAFLRDVHWIMCTWHRDVQVMLVWVCVRRVLACACSRVRARAGCVYVALHRRITSADQASRILNCVSALDAIFNVDYLFRTFCRVDH